MRRFLLARRRTRIGVLMLVGVTGCTDDVFLDTGDMMTVSVDPSPLYIGSAIDGCGARIHIRAAHADGSEAGDTRVQLWTTGSGTASLSVDAITLSEDGTDATACLVASAGPGTTTLHARSGPVEATTDIEVRRLEVPSTGHLELTPMPVFATANVPASSCGHMAAETCSSGVRRETQIVIQATPGETDPVPEGARVSLTSSYGWVATDRCEGADKGAVQIELSGGVAFARACFPDLAGSATFTVQSGSATQRATVVVPAIPRNVALVPSQSIATAGNAISFVAFVSDCQGHGVADVPLALQTKSGAFTPDSGTPVTLTSGADGTVTISGTATAVPLEIGVSILGTPQVGCASMIGAHP